MRALVLESAPANGANDTGASPRLLRDYPDPVRQPTEALIAVRLAGVCDTDIQLTRGYGAYRGVLGHEMVGEVIDADDRNWIGRRVVADINDGCGSCEDCRERDGHHCNQRTVLGIAGRDGAIAERVVVAARSLVAVPDQVSDEQAVFAEPLAAAAHVLDVVGDVSDAGDAPDNPIIVLGDGKLGLLIVLVLRATDRVVILVGHHEEKLALAAATGAGVTMAASAGEMPRAAVVVEATGSGGGLQQALSLVRPRGRVILKSTIAEPTSIDLTPVVVDEIALVGSRCGDIERAVELLATGSIDPTPLIAARYGLDDAEEALRHAAKPGVLKVLVKP